MTQGYLKTKAREIVAAIDADKRLIGKREVMNHRNYVKMHLNDERHPSEYEDSLHFLLENLTEEVRKTIASDHASELTELAES